MVLAEGPALLSRPVPRGVVAASIAVPLALSALWVAAAMAGASLKAPYGALASLGVGGLFIAMHGLWGKAPRAEQRRKEVYLLPLRTGRLSLTRAIGAFLFLAVGYLMVDSWFIGPVEESRPELLSASLVATCVVVPFIEEVAFRGWMLRRTEAALGARRAVLVTAFFFALLHLSLTGFPVRFAFGVVAAGVVYATGSLWSSILLHVVYNSLLLALGRVPEVDAFLDAGPRDPALLGLGLAFGTLGMLGLGLTLWRSLRKGESGVEPQLRAPEYRRSNDRSVTDDPGRRSLSAPAR